MLEIILAAVDQTPRAEGVLRMAVTMADRFGSTVHLFHAVHVEPEFPPAAHVEARDMLPSYLQNLANQYLRDLAARVPGADVARPLVRIGDAWHAIIAASREVRADLIVLGTHGYSGIDRILGTTTGKVATHAPCHVFVVHS